MKNTVKTRTKGEMSTRELVGKNMQEATAGHSVSSFTSGAARAHHLTSSAKSFKIFVAIILHG